MTTMQPHVPVQRGAINATVRQRKRTVVKALEPKVFCARVEQVFAQNPCDFLLVAETLNNDKALDLQTYSTFFVDLLVSGGLGFCQGRPDTTQKPFEYSLFHIEETRVQDLLNLFDYFLKRQRALSPAVYRSFHNILVLISHPYLTEERRDRFARLIATAVCPDYIQLGSTDITQEDEDVYDYEEEENEQGTASACGIANDALIAPLFKESHVESGLSFSFFAMLARHMVTLTDVAHVLKLLEDAHVLQHLHQLLPPGQHDNEDAVCSTLEEANLDWLCGPYRSALELQRDAAIVGKLQKSVRELGISREPDGSDGDEWKEAPQAKIDHFRALVEELLGKQDAVERCLKIIQTLFEADDSMNIQDRRRALYRWAPLLRSYVSSDKAPEDQGSLLLGFQRLCFDSHRIIDFFGEFVVDLYGTHVLCEDVILAWDQLGVGCGTKFFRTQLQGFVSWLKTTAEDE